MVENQWLQAALWMGLALIATILSLRIAISIALLEIMVGVIGGNFLPLQRTEWVNFLAGFGSILLTFLAGAEVEPEILRKRFKESVGIGFLSFLMPFLGAMAYAYNIGGWTFPQAAIAGISLSTTSVAVVYAVMIETGYNETELGKFILAACFITDLGTVIALGIFFPYFFMPKGHITFITGHSGAGKSTMLKLIAMLDRPSTGDIIVNGKVLNKLKPKHIPAYRMELGIILQQPNLLNDRSVFANVAMPLQIQNIKPYIIRKRVQAALDMVDLLHKERNLPQQLSGGEQQRISIARAIVHKPKLLLADEPTGNLDNELSIEIMNIFSNLNQTGVSALIATHDLPLIANTKHDIIVLKKGYLS